MSDIELDTLKRLTSPLLIPTGGIPVDISLEEANIDPFSGLIREKLSLEDLSAVDSDINKVRARFAELYDNVLPDGFCVNSEGAFDVFRPLQSENYQLFCYKNSATPKFETHSPAKKTPLILGSNSAVNRSNQEATVSLSVTGSWTRAITWKFESSLGMKLNAKVSFLKFFEIGGEVNASITVGVGGSESETHTVSGSVTVKLPPHSKQTVSLLATTTRETAKFTIPVWIEKNGFFCANFPHPVRGHYFWFQTAYNLLPRLNGDWVGELRLNSVVDIYTEIGEIVPI